MTTPVYERRDLKEDALQSELGGNCQTVGLSFPMGYVMFSKRSMSSKIGSRQTTNQFSFVLYASLKKKICNIILKESFYDGFCK